MQKLKIEEPLDIKHLVESLPEVIKKLERGRRLVICDGDTPLFAVISNDDLKLLLCLEIENAENDDDEILNALENVIDEH